MQITGILSPSEEVEEMAEESIGAVPADGGKASPDDRKSRPLNFLAEVYGEGVYAGAWFETVEQASAWIETQANRTWHQITPRETVLAQTAKQDALLKSMGSPKIQRWVQPKNPKVEPSPKGYL